MAERLDVLKTYKLFIDGKFPRSESGRALMVADASGKPVAHICHASRKDLRDAVEAARKARPGWAGATSYNRGQILYRMAEMIEGKRAEFVEALALGAAGAKPSRGKARGLTPDAEVSAAIDRLVAFAGWADKFAQVLGCQNPVAGPFYNFTVPDATGVVAIVAPDEPGLLGLVSLIAPAVCAGNTAVVVAGDRRPIAASVLGEVCATSDVPAGVVNILTGQRAELVPFVAGHRDIDAVVGANLPTDVASALRAGSAENVKRVTIHTVSDFSDAQACTGPWWIEPTVEFKTIWHPSSV
ncbi:MAG: aldehyde dehydrogenase family protein [Planctomycetota bacterium]|nr:aldehyde dehydrogenase family protein [Planctomycetota bacterium]